MFNGKQVLLSALIVAGTASISHAGGLNVNVDIGVPAPVYAPAPPPPAYVPAPQVVLPAVAPQFVFVPELGYYVAVGTPYDIAYIGNQYYMYNNGVWFRSAYYGGPLVRIERRMWPQLLVRHNMNDFHRFREAEFKRFDHDRAHYRGQMHRPEVRHEVKKEEHAVRKEEHEMRKEERREERH